jgi:hypothetical protein
MARYVGVATEVVFQHQATLSPASVAANTSAEQTFTVPGLTVGGVVYVNKPTAQAGLGIVGARISAANTLAINFGNFTASPIVPTASEVYNIVSVRIIGN